MVVIRRQEVCHLCAVLQTYNHMVILPYRFDPYFTTVFGSMSFGLPLCLSLCTTSVLTAVCDSMALFTSSVVGGKCDCRRLSVCLLARLLKNAWMDLDDRYRDTEELIDF